MMLFHIDGNLSPILSDRTPMGTVTNAGFRNVVPVRVGKLHGFNGHVYKIRVKHPMDFRLKFSRSSAFAGGPWVQVLHLSRHIPGN
jgi:hypothetical protein